MAVPAVWHCAWSVRAELHVPAAELRVGRFGPVAEEDLEILEILLKELKG